MARTKRHFIPGYVLMFQPVITCQKCNPKLINSNYIYRITLHPSQKGKPSEMNLPLLKKTISQCFKALKTCLLLQQSQQHRLVIWYSGITKNSGTWYFDFIADITAMHHLTIGVFQEQISAATTISCLCSLSMTNAGRYHQKIEKAAPILSVSWPIDSWVRVAR